MLSLKSDKASLDNIKLEVYMYRPLLICPSSMIILPGPVLAGRYRTEDLDDWTISVIILCQVINGKLLLGANCEVL